MRPRHTALRRGARDAAALVPPLFAFGAAFGVLAVEAGLPQWLGVLASVIVLSGSAQFAMLALLPGGAAGVLVATTGLALRHVPMSASLRRLLPSKLPWWRRLGLTHVLVDETFGLTVAAVGRGETAPQDYKTGADVVLLGTWVVSTAAGAYLGTVVDAGRLGLEDLFPLMFLGLAAPLLRSRRDWVTAAAAVVAALVAVLTLPEAWRVTSAAVIGAAVGSVRRG